MSEAIISKEELKKIKRREISARYRQQNPEKIKAYRDKVQKTEEYKQYQREWQEANRDKSRAYTAKWYDANSEQARAYRKEYYQNNHEQELESARKYRETHPETIKKATDTWRLNNHERYKQSKKEYQINNRDKLAKIHREYRKKRPDIVRKTERKHFHKRKRELGFEPLNEFFIGSHAHHVNKTYVVYVPEDLHTSIPHDQNKPETMIVINKKVWEYFWSNNPLTHDYIFLKRLEEETTKIRF